MSYNIDTWKTKELTDFKIELNKIYDPKSSWQPDKPVLDTGTGKFLIENACEDFEMIGTIDSGWFTVESIRCRSEGSGSFMAYGFSEWLPTSKGKLVAIRIWEGGDTIDRLTIDNGAVTIEEVDL
jgi:hypothetical protein